jgi:hypothetical protein
MKAVSQLVGSIASTISILFGKTSGLVRLLVILTVLLVPGALVLQIALRWWMTHRTNYRQSTIDAVTWRPGYRGLQESRRGLIHTSQRAQKSSEAIYEYALYGFIIFLTALTIVFYTAATKDQQLSSLNIYAGAVYLGLLGWIFHRLNALYRRRKQVDTDVPGTDSEGFDIPTELVRSDGKPDAAPVRELVHAYSPQAERSILGLTITQFAIALAVFVAACLTFTWALTRLH